MHKTLWMVLSLIVITACSSTFPDWSISPPQDTSNLFITTGSGNNLESAKSNALEQLSNRLIVDVANTTLTNNVKNAQNQVTQSIESYGVLNSEQFSFINATVLKSQQVNGVVHVLMQVDKKSVFDSIHNYLDIQVVPLIMSNQDSAQIISNGVLLWPQLTKAEKYVSLLTQHNQDKRSIKSQLSNFKEHFINILSETDISLVVGATQAQHTSRRQSSQLININDRLHLQYQSLLTKKPNASNKVEIIILGPTISYFDQAPIHAVKIEAQQVVTFNKKIVVQRPITAFELGDNKDSVMVAAQNNFVNQLSLGSK